jgi:hypothetical protein
MVLQSPSVSQAVARKVSIADGLTFWSIPTSWQDDQSNAS